MHYFFVPDKLEIDLRGKLGDLELEYQVLWQVIRWLPQMRIKRIGV